MPELLTVLLGVVAGAVVAGAGTVIAVRTLRRHAAADTDAAVHAAVNAVLAVAGEKLGDHRASAERELELRQQNISEQMAGINQSFELQVGGLNRSVGQQLAGMNDELLRVSALVHDLQRDRAAQHGQVIESIQQAARQTASLSEVTQGLREALSNSRARGQWGERMADDVLRAAGLVEGVNYRKQRTLASGGRPDFTFLLPHERLLHMDVKFPIDNYLRYLEAVGDGGDHQAANGYRLQFLNDVRQRVKEITARDYIDPDTTLGYVLLFIPNEAVYGFVHEHDPALIDVALQERVVLCSPFSLFAVLGVVRQAVESVQLQQTSDEILRGLTRFSAQWAKFSESLDTVGKRFESAQRAFDEVSGTRRRQLQRTLDEVDRLRAARGLPAPADAEPAEASEAEQRALAAVAGGEPAVPDVPGDTGGDATRIPRLRPIRGR
ncbi:MAG: DNA recombination protein RmuC [Actinobacteria bacterium]|nr:DNA recombination protein RmuC [Actinomycetota bacterium]